MKEKQFIIKIESSNVDEAIEKLQKIKELLNDMGDINLEIHTTEFIEIPVDCLAVSDSHHKS